MPLNDNNARWDAETLAEAKTIESNPIRFNAAKIAAGRMAADQQERTNNLKKVSGSKKDTSASTNPRKQTSMAPKPIAKPANGGGQGYNVFQKI